MKINNTYNFPNLPVPDQKETLMKFLDWTAPLISEQEMINAKKLVDEFLKNPLSKKLHNILIERAKDVNNSWLVDWWVKYVYLTTRGPVTPENNAPMVFSCNHLKDYSTSEAIALITYAISSVYLELKQNNNLINDLTFYSKKAYSLDQLIYLFSSFREANIDVDEYYTNEQTSDFILVLKNNVFYKVKVIENNEVIDYNEINKQLKYILDSDLKQEVNFNFISSCTNRNHIKPLVDEIISDETNKNSYQQIKDAIAIICYDDFEAKNEKILLKHYMSSHDYNRMHAKSLIINVLKDNQVVLCAEHTKVDGGTEIYLMYRIDQWFQKNIVFNKDIKPIKCEQLTFNLTKQQKEKLINEHQKYLDYIHRSDAEYLEFKNLNRDFCKAHGILSADGLIHILLQIAQYKTNQKFFNTYVAVDTRNFFKGRTECIRPISQLSTQFAIDFVNNKFNNKQQLLEALKPVLDIHYLRSKECQQGLGINRYMLGLVLAYNENYLNEPKPSLFDSVAWQTINANIFSTSSIVSENIEWVYFDPVHNDGLGIFYAMKKSYTRFCISYWVKDQNYAKAFIKNLEWAIETFLEIILNKGE